MSLRHLNASQLSELLDMDRRTVKDRLRDVKPYGMHGKAILFVAAEVIPILLGNGTQSDNQLDRQLREETLRLEKAKADKTTLEVEKLRGEVVDASEVAKIVGAEYTNVRARLMSIGSRAAIDLAPEISAALAKEIVDREVNEALAELSADTKYEEINDVEQSFRPPEADTPENP